MAENKEKAPEVIEEKIKEPSSSNPENKHLIITLISQVILFALFAVVIYFMVDNVVTQKVSKIQVSTEELEEEEDAEDEIQKGIIVDLGDFILNLCDEAQKKYLKVNVAIEVSQKDTDFPKAEGEAKGGHGHEAPAPAADPMEAIQKEMAQYKPAIRDAVITNLSSKTSAELSSAAGKELAKEQITNDINSILGGEREVLRVSFGQFIIQ